MKYGVEIIRRPDPVPEGLKRIFEVCSHEGELVVVISEGVVYNGYLIQHAGAVFAAIQDRVRDYDNEHPVESGPDPAAPEEIKPPERIQWWPEAVVCSKCDASVELKEEPPSYIIDCPFCDHMIIVHPVADENDNAPMTRSQFNELLDNTEERIVNEERADAVKEFSLGRSPKVEAELATKLSSKIKKIERVRDKVIRETVIKKAAQSAVDAARTGSDAEGIADAFAESIGEEVALLEAKETAGELSEATGVPLELPADIAELDREIAESEERNA